MEIDATLTWWLHRQWPSCHRINFWNAVGVWLRTRWLLVLGAKGVPGWASRRLGLGLCWLLGVIWDLGRAPRLFARTQPSKLGFASDPWPGLVWLVSTEGE